MVLTWAEVAAGGLVGAGSGTYASTAVRGHYAHHNQVTAALTLLGCGVGISLVLQTHPALFGAACVALLAAALPLAAIDAATRTLPDRLLLPAIGACLVPLTLAAACGSDFGPLWRAGAAGVVVFAAFTALALALPGQLGFGDCKAAALCALPLGYLGWHHVLLGNLAAYLCAAVYVLGRRLAGRSSSTLAFGPFLFAGAMIALFVG